MVQLSKSQVGIIQYILLSQHTNWHRSRSYNRISHKIFQLGQHLAQATFYLSFIDNFATTVFACKMNILHIAPMHVVLWIFTKKNHCCIRRTFVCKVVQMNCSQLFLNITSIVGQDLIINNLRKILSLDKVCINIFDGCTKARCSIKCCHI